MPLAERVHKVRLLLVTLNDGYPTTQGSLDVPSGVAEGKRVPCDDCKRRGWIRTRQGDVLCLLCDGSGWRKGTGTQGANRAGERVNGEMTGGGDRR